MAIAQKFEIFHNRRLKTLALKKYILPERTKFGPVIKKLRRDETKRMVAFLDRFEFIIGQREFLKAKNAIFRFWPAGAQWNWPE